VFDLVDVVRVEVRGRERRSCALGGPERFAAAEPMVDPA
jgi:hypothetical protein